MENRNLKREIEFEMRNVPRLGTSWRYIPLTQMPVGTEIWFDTSNKSTPGELEPRYNPDPEDELDNAFLDTTVEKDVLRLPEGRYGLRMGETNAITLIYPDASEEAVKPLYNLLAPTSCFQANVDRVKPKLDHPDDPPTTTFRLTTGTIDAIFIPGTRFNLTLTDEEKEGAILIPFQNKGGRNNRYPVSGDLHV